MGKKLQTEARRALDARRAELSSARHSTARPSGGWVRAVREALGMSAADLANRMGVTQSTVARLEASERAGTVQLNTLRSVADALNCEVVYALVPRQPLEEQVDEQAHRRARQRLTSLGHTMALEDQAVGGERMRQWENDLAEELKNSHRLWKA